MDLIDELADGPPATAVPRLLAAVERLLDPSNAEDYTMSVQAVAAAAILAGEGSELWQTKAWEIPPLTADLAATLLEAVDNAHADGGIVMELVADASRVADHRSAAELLRKRLRAAIPPPQVETLF